MNLPKKRIVKYSVFALILLIAIGVEGYLWWRNMYPKRTVTVIEYVGPKEVIELNEVVVHYVDEEGNIISIATYTETISTVTFVTTYSIETITEIEETVIYVGGG